LRDIIHKQSDLGFKLMGYIIILKDITRSKPVQEGGT
jgi:hypothetical protein